MSGEKLILRLLYLSPTLTVVPLEFKNAVYSSEQSITRRLDLTVGPTVTSI